MSFDLLVVAGFLIVLIFGSMRLLYGAWPWEAGKTWYHTRHAVEYGAALRRARIDRALSQLADTFNGSKDFAVSVTPLPPVAGDASGDSFDRGLMVQDSSPPEVPPPTAKQLTLVHPTSRIGI